MMLSSFIRRNGKRKAGKKTEQRSHQKSSSTFESPQLAPPLVIDINDESLPTLRLPAIEANVSNASEEWFPLELRRCRSRSSETPLRRAQNATAIQNSSTQETHANPKPSPSLGPLENLPLVTSRKKSIPAPIVIPDPEYLMPSVQKGRPTVTCGAAPPEASRPNANGAPVNSPSPSASDDLSAISGTTLARALIASSFVLSSSDHRNSRQRSVVARQDSATLPLASFFLSDPEDSSLIPPVPPVPAMLVSVPPRSTIRSGSSTESEYPASDAYITSPEMVLSSVPPRRISRIQENPSFSPPMSTMACPPVIPDVKPQRKGGPVPRRPRAPKFGVFDGPKTAVEVPLPISSPEIIQHSSQEGSSLPGSDDQSLDDFDFVPPENVVAVASTESDSSASYILPYTPLHKRGDINRGLRKRRLGGTGGTNLVRDDSRDKFLVDGGTVSQQVHDIPSAATSEHDYGELFNYDLTVSAESGVSSSASAGYQTFPETPMVFSPLWSSGHAHLAKPDSHLLRRRLSDQKSAAYRSAKLYPSVKTTSRHVGNIHDLGGAVILRRSWSSLLPKPKIPPLKHAEPKPLPSVRVSDDANVPDEGNKLSMTNITESRRSVEILLAPRPHLPAHVSSSSSLLGEEALRILAQSSSSSLPSFIIGGVDHSYDQTTVAASVTGPSDQSPASIPLFESTSVTLSDPASLVDSSTTVSSSPSPLQSSHSTTDTAISQSCPSKFSSSPPSTSQESSFLPSLSPSTSQDESLPRPRSPTGAVSSSIASDDLIYHSPSPSLIPPPPYHAIALEKTTHHPRPAGTPLLSRTSSAEPIYLHSRQPFNSSLIGSVRSRMRSRPPLPIGPRNPSRPGQVFSSLFPGIEARSSTSSMGSGDGLGLSWRRLHTAASQPPPNFQVPPPKWRGLTLEAAQWMFTSAQLQKIISQAIQQTSEGSSLRFVKPDLLDGEVADEAYRLELQYLDVKAQYKALVRKRWALMGTLAGHVEGVGTSDIATAARTVGELAEVLLGLDRLADKMHQIVHQMAQLKNLRDVHNASSMAMAVRKINGLFVRQMAEKERLQQQVDAFRTERDEAWKHAEELAQDFDRLNDRVAESTCGCDDAKVNADASSTYSSRSARISAVRKSSIWQSQAGLRSRNRHRTRWSSGSTTRPTSLALEDIPPIPCLRTDPSIGSTEFSLVTSTSFGSAHNVAAGASAALALADAQREVYEMLGLGLPTTPASSRCRTIPSPDATGPTSPRSRPVSESSDARMRVRRSAFRQGLGTRSMSVIPDQRCPVLPLATTRR